MILVVEHQKLHIPTATYIASGMAMLISREIFILIVSMLQACLLDARRLRVAVQPAVVSSLHNNEFHTHTSDEMPTTGDNGDPTNTIPPSNKPPTCSPHEHQLKYYNGLYSSNTFNGNILYYALKAVETHKNMTAPVATAEDNETIANITDQSRFIPAGMELVNKVVCAKLLQEMDAEASLFSSTALCAWDYVCDYEADRYPHYLFKARCKTSKCNVACSHDKHHMCQSHGIHVTILEKRQCKEWVWGQDLLPLACTCTTEDIVQAENGMSG